MSAENKNVPTMVIELVDQQKSGFIREDTRGTAFQEELTAPSIEFIPNIGNMAEEIIENGQPTGRYKNTRIRYIKGCDFIKIDEQEKLGYEPSRISTNDQIPIRKGKAIIKREGDIALFDYLKHVLYSLNAVNREKISTNAKVLFRVVDVEKHVEIFNEGDFLQAEAVQWIANNLRSSVGKDKYIYHEDKIDNILTVMNLFGGDIPSEKIKAITIAAKGNPKGFLDLVSKLANVVITEVTHSIELGVIKIEGTTAEFVDGKKILATDLPKGNSMDKKISALADMLRTPEYAQAYQELKAKLELAQEKLLK